MNVDDVMQETERSGGDEVVGESRPRRRRRAVVTAAQPKPNSAEWLAEVEKTNPELADHVRQQIADRGAERICTLCGSPRCRAVTLAKDRSSEPWSSFSNGMEPDRLNACKSCVELLKRRGRPLAASPSPSDDASQGGEAVGSCFSWPSATELIRFAPTSDTRQRCGTSLKGFTPLMTYYELVELFGPPNAEGGLDYKTSSEWWIEDTRHPRSAFTIYDYRAGKDLRAPEGSELEKFRQRRHQWSVGGYEGVSADTLTAWLGARLAVLRDEARAVYFNLDASPRPLLEEPSADTSSQPAEAALPFEQDTLGDTLSPTLTALEAPVEPYRSEVEAMARARAPSPWGHTAPRSARTKLFVLVSALGAVSVCTLGLLLDGAPGGATPPSDDPGILIDSAASESYASPPLSDQGAIEHRSVNSTFGVVSARRLAVASLAPAEKLPSWSPEVAFESGGSTTIRFGRSWKSSDGLALRVLAPVAEQGKRYRIIGKKVELGFVFEAAILSRVVDGKSEIVVLSGTNSGDENEDENETTEASESPSSTWLSRLREALSVLNPAELRDHRLRAP
jgi:hypothetical protein